MVELLTEARAVAMIEADGVPESLIFWAAAGEPEDGSLHRADKATTSEMRFS